MSFHHSVARQVKQNQQIHAVQKKHGQYPWRVCMLTMADGWARAKYAPQIRSHVCYARRHNITYTIATADKNKHNKAHIQYQKVGAVWNVMNRSECDWVAWLDADVYVTNPERSWESWLHPDTQLALTGRRWALDCDSSA